MTTSLAIRNEKQYLSHISEVRALVGKCEHVSDAKDLSDRARAAEVWAQRAKLGAEKVNLAAAAKLWAERRAGELLTGSTVPGGNRRNGSYPKKSLPDGITKKESHRWQKLAAIDADTFAEEIERLIPEGRITYAEIMRRKKRTDRETAKREQETALVGKDRGATDVAQPELEPASTQAVGVIPATDVGPAWFQDADIDPAKLAEEKARRAAKDAEREAKRAENAALVEAQPIAADLATDTARYATIVVDPPWSWEDEGGVFSVHDLKVATAVATSSASDSHRPAFIGSATRGQERHAAASRWAIPDDRRRKRSARRGAR